MLKAGKNFKMEEIEKRERISKVLFVRNYIFSLFSVTENQTCVGRLCCTNLAINVNNFLMVFIVIN